MLNKRLSFIVSMVMAITMLQPTFTAMAVDISDAPTAIAIVNNVSKRDTITVDGVKANDTVKVYSKGASGSGTLLQQAIASGTSVTISVAQLGKNSGSIYVGVKTANLNEYISGEQTFKAEDITEAIDSAKVIAANNAVVADTVTVKNSSTTFLAVGTVVKVYNKNDSTKKVIGTSTVVVGKDSVTINIPKFPLASGNVYVSATSPNMLESDLTPVAYTAELVSTAATDITVTNTIKTDKVLVKSLAGGDVVKVYADGEKKKLLGSATVPVRTPAVTEATVSVAQVGKTAGAIYVTVTTPKKLESNVTKKTFSAEDVTVAPIAGRITPVNNAVVIDEVTVTILTPGDIVKVYADSEKRKLLGVETVLTGKNEVIVKAKLPTATLGKIYVSLTNKDKLESPVTQVSYGAEVATSNIISSQINTNNTIKVDTVKVTGLNPGDIVKVYNSNDVKKKVIGSGTVAKDKHEITVNTMQMGKTEGSVYVTVTKSKLLESGLVAAAFIDEPVTIAPVAGNITTVNNGGAPDTVKVTGLKVRDIVKVYNSNDDTKKVIGTATVGKDKTEVTVNIPKFAFKAGNIYVSIITKDKLESQLTEKAYIAEVQSTKLTALTDVIIVNNVGSDIILVRNVKEGDIIKAYRLELDTKPLAIAKVGKGQKAVLLNGKLGADAGSIYVSVTCKNKNESEKVKATFLAE